MNVCLCVCVRFYVCMCVCVCVCSDITDCRPSNSIRWWFPSIFPRSPPPHTHRHTHTHTHTHLLSCDWLLLIIESASWYPDIVAGRLFVSFSALPCLNVLTVGTRWGKFVDSLSRANIKLTRCAQLGLFLPPNDFLINQRFNYFMFILDCTSSRTKCKFYVAIMIRSKNWKLKLQVFDLLKKIILQSGWYALI